MVEKSRKGGDGCLRLFIISILTVIIFGILEVTTHMSFLFAIVLAIIISVGITSLILGRPSGKTMFRNSIITVLFFICIYTVGNFLLKFLVPLNHETPTFTTEDVITETSIVENNDTIAVYSNNRTWRDNYGNNYSGELSVRTQDFLRLQNHIASYVPPSSANFWGNLYDYIDRKDTPSLDLVAKTFQNINTQSKLNQMEFAEMVVSCIQDIPYSFVFQEECLPAHYYEDSIKDILEECPDCCIGNIMYGIQNPVSFIQNLKGDCDTRTVIIYSILKDFGYDVAILNSEFYRHSILGINLPASGLHKIYNGKKYVLWETTAKHFEVGYLSPNFNDVSHWNVVLTSK